MPRNGPPSRAPISIAPDRSSARTATTTKAWSTGFSPRPGPFKNWKYYIAHTMLPDGQNVFDFGDVWEGPLTRAGKGEEYDRVYPGGNHKLQSNYNVLYRVARRLNDPETQAVAARLATFGHS